MCGRYAASRNPDELVEQFEIEEDDLPPGDDAPAPSFNVAPTQTRPVVLTRAPAPADDPAAEDPRPVRRLQALRWGLVPSWAKDIGIGNRFINSRSESLLQTAAFKRAAVARRCLVPADGWYEWQRSPTEKDAKGKPRKQPFFMARADGDELAFAGIYELWRDPAKHDDDPARWLFSYSIVTTAAEPGLDVIHDRMPLVLDRQEWARWLDPAMTDPDGVRALLQPHRPGRFTTLPVSTRVNNVRNDGPELLEPAPEDQLQGVLDPATGELLGATGQKLF
jgi:putative SOS response-associated peptidase YedK